LYLYENLTLWPRTSVAGKTVSAEWKLLHIADGTG